MSLAAVDSQPLPNAHGTPDAELGARHPVDDEILLTRDLLAGTNHLVDPPLVVAEQRRRRLDHGGRAPVVDLQWVGLGPGEELLVIDEVCRVGSEVSVDDLIVVADSEDIEPGAGEEADQEHIGRGEVLELIDDQVPASVLPVVPELGIGQQRLDGSVHLLVEVGLATAVQHLPVSVVDPGEVGDVVTKLLDVVRRAQPDAHLAKSLEIRADDVGALPARGVNQPVQPVPLLPLVDQSHAAPRLAEDLPTERVDRPHLETAVTQPLPHLGGGPVVVGKGTDQLRLERRGRPTRCRSRAMRVRVFPEPAGATMRAGPAPCSTAAAWSGASPSETVETESGAGSRRPRSTDSVEMTGSVNPGTGPRGPPSTQASMPSASTMSRSDPGRAPRASALRPHHHTSSPLR